MSMNDNKLHIEKAFFSKASQLEGNTIFSILDEENISSPSLNPGHVSFDGQSIVSLPVFENKFLEYSLNVAFDKLTYSKFTQLEKAESLSPTISDMFSNAILERDVQL